MTDFVSNGQITVSSTGIIRNVGSSLFSLGGGSVTTVNLGGLINVGVNPGTANALLSGGLLINNGAFGSAYAALVVDFGGLAKGTGVYGSVITQNGGYTRRSGNVNRG